MKKSLIRMASIGAVAALLATMAPQLAHAATQPAWDTTTDGTVYLMDNTNAVQFADGTQMDWNPANGVVLTANAVPASLGDLSWATFAAPTGASKDYIPFLSLPGAERTPKAWKAWSDPSLLGGVGALLPNVAPGAMLYGAPGAVKASGGTFSMGIAYTDSAIVASTNVVKAYYVTVNVDATTGAWKFSTYVPKPATTTALTTSASAVAAGDPVTLTATVSPATATGNVTFNEGSTLLGTSASAAGIATLTTTALAAGSHAITATYAGDAAFTGSTSSAVTVTVNTGPDSSLLVAGNAGSVTASLSGTVATLSVPATLNGKKVNVFGYSAPVFLAQVTISGGSLQVNVASFTTGTHQIAIVDATNGTILGWVTVTIPNAAQTAPRDLQAVIATSIDGTFALIGPDNTTPAVIGNPTLDPITGESVSTGTLGAFQVKDDRSISKKGWTLTADVNNFVNGATSIDKKALGIKPILGVNSGPGLPTVGAEQIAGSAVYAMQFAELVAGTYSTTTNLNADLKFRAPLGTTAGTYTSTLTLTLVSK
jgi:Bacterial Ig-like domain (group 3)